MTQINENPAALERFGASKTFEPSQVEHLTDSPLIEAKQGVSDNMIKGVVRQTRTSLWVAG